VFVRTEATILHADLDSFYASVEQRDDPRLRGRPVIVGSGVVLAASYEAKAYGVCGAMGGAQARRLCPAAIVVEPRMSAYSEASKAVFEVFGDTTPLVEGLSIDEAFLDVGGLRRVSGTPTEIAVRLRRDVLERVGLPITVGAASPNPTVCWWCHPTVSSHSSTRSRSNASGGSDLSPRSSSTTAGS
jgi:DNA polymerase-4